MTEKITKIIHKYILTPTLEQSVELPLGAQILSVLEQRDDVVVYVLIPVPQPDQKLYKWKFFIEGTGLPLVADTEECDFLGTVSLHNGFFMWHVFVERKL